MENINFIRTELSGKDSSEYDRIIVILPEWRGCITEPCEPWVGFIAGIDYHLTSEGAYRYALSTIGISPDSKSIEFLNDYPISEKTKNAILIDWNKFASARKQYYDQLEK